jgi:uncharacterized protein (DUF1501 family)
MTTRRELLKAAGAAIAASNMPGLVLARADTDARFVLVILRGAADGLAIVPPFGDGNYRRIRGELALPPPDDRGGLLKLDGLFGLHPSLPGIFEQYRQKQALFIHAVASPYRDRSHFDGQDVLENGAADVGMLRDGWLNRAIAPLGGSLGNEVAIAMAQNTPLVLRGNNSVTSWAPSRLPDAEDSTIRRLQDLYSGDEFFATRLAQALDAQAIAAGDSAISGMVSRGNEGQQMQTIAEATARFLSAEDGPRVAVIEAGGWDTHANQGASEGPLANRLGNLDSGLDTLRKHLGQAWSHTVVAIVTEFGRTVAVNGTRGTDHGTATAAILAGGAVRGGKVRCDWPGLQKASLYQERDLMPTTDLRSVFKGILSEHLGLPESLLETTVFPDSKSAPAMRNIIAG